MSFPGAVKNHWDAALYEGKHNFVWEAGSALVDLLQPKASERILDLGCGTGQLTDQIARAGASVLGIDASPEMIGQARQNYPKLRFALQDGETMRFEDPFDAIFSNAALHWMRNPQAVIEAMHSASKEGGRLVAEFGGHGNVQRIESTLRSVLAEQGCPVPASPWFFPSVSQYSSMLEANGFEVRLAHLFDRDTFLSGADGMEDWLRQFAGMYLRDLEAKKRLAVMKETADRLRPVAATEGGWIADYRRLRIVAVKLA